MTMLTYEHPPPFNHVPPPPQSKASTTVPNGRRHSSKSLAPSHRHIFLVTGPAGSGKSTIAKHLADTFNFPYIEGDEYHTKEAVQKMASGVPLNDADRWSWLILLRNVAAEKLQEGADGVIVTCSALKQQYRDVIRIAAYYDHNLLVHFIYLHAPEDLLVQRVKERKGHYMKDSMVKSQLQSLEPPGELESIDSLTVDVSGSREESQQHAYEEVYRLLVDDSNETNGA